MKKAQEIGKRPIEKIGVRGKRPANFGAGAEEKAGIRGFGREIGRAGGASEVGREDCVAKFTTDDSTRRLRSQ